MKQTPLHEKFSDKSHNNHSNSALFHSHVVSKIMTATYSHHCHTNLLFVFIEREAD